MVLRPPMLGLAAILLVLALGACRPDSATDPSGEPYVVGKGDRYVALGDSYTAAPLTGPLAGLNGCGRTQVNYPHLVAKATGAELIDNSCSGANTRHLTEPQQTRFDQNPPQLEGLGADTDLVTFRLGANDYGFVGRIILCAQSRIGEGSSPSPCTDLDEDAGSGSAEERLEDLEQNLVRALRSVVDRAPQATVIVVGYPQIVPAEGTCDQLPLKPGDYPYARRINVGLNEALEAAAEQVGVTFIDMFPVSEGHDICGEVPWIAGDKPKRRDATRWHPFPEESQAVAELVLAELE
ncbi:SGNH/GDSL hydrolase family protein [Nocardioides antri]|uniref:SGNH/GDSL hydrolase family protein n=1 Tax=Nocardioides antri TaxID=2607659 RepID=A0A5B1M3Y5_9ACTN|nr:SGNH/GDSL hydrolase family protein [Nocardioides antri]KAA1427461.1 SGNH/GDSL hydrolase family protein [Nocardioides antri]